MKIVFILFLFLSTISSFAQDKKDAPKKKEYKLSATIKTVKGQLKDGKNNDANNEIEKAVKEHQEARSSAQLYALKAQALQNLVLDENKKMYLKQNPDTVKYFSLIYSLYQAALNCDSIEQIPDEKGRVKFKYRNSNQQRLLQFRKNLSTADKFFYNKKDYKNAYNYANLYLSSKKSSVFNRQKGDNALAGENDSIAHASLAVFLAYAYKNYNGVIKYLDIAKLDTTRLSQIYVVGSQSYYALGDTVKANAILHKGIEEFPTNDYFYMTLLRYYNDRHDYAEGVKVINSVIGSMPENRNCLFLLSKEYEYAGNLDKAIEVMTKLVELNSKDYPAYCSLGNMYLEKAQIAYRNFNKKVTDPDYQKGRNAVNELYRKAMQAFENCRKNVENKTELWIDGLRECYYRLNMGKELKSLEKIKK